MFLYLAANKAAEPIELFDITIFNCHNNIII